MNRSDHNIRVRNKRLHLLCEIICAMHAFSKVRDDLSATCALLAGEGEVVVARDIVPLAVLMPDHHYAVLARREEAVRLVGPPVFILLK